VYIYLFQLILGFIQGFTEFFPISSSGHLALANAIARACGITIPETTVLMEVTLHLATVLAVILVFWRDWWHMIVAIFRPAPGDGGYFKRLWADPNGRLLINVIVGTIPAAIAGALLEKRIEAAFDAPQYISLFLMITGVLLLVTFVLARGEKKLSELGIGFALLVGIAQAVALLPGISRSGATICMALFMGAIGTEAARFSLILSVPAVLGAVAKKGMELGSAGGSISLGLGLGFVVALVVGYLTIRWLLVIMRNRRFVWFGVYCTIIGIVFFILTSMSVLAG
jgi:undecaprenyl-diphosphatase